MSKVRIVKEGVAVSKDGDDFLVQVDSFRAVAFTRAEAEALVEIVAELLKEPS